MKIGVLGTGVVGEAIATKLIELGHDVMMGSRTKTNEKAMAWAEKHGGKAGDYTAAAAHGEILLNCTKGDGSLAALKQAGAMRLKGKVLIDIANALSFIDGQLSLSVVNTDSLAETIQRTYPAVKVVKALNTMNCAVMVDPARVPGMHTVFLCGNDRDARLDVAELLKSFGWQDIIDLGDLTAARGMEMVLPIWLKLTRAVGTTDFNFAINRKA